MLGPVQPTPFDLYFSLAGIPVRVVPTFWLAGVLFGWPAVREERFDLLLVWIGCLFFSILVHEMGHALVAKAYGWAPQVFLYHFGGLAMFHPFHNYTMGRSIFVSFAGPGAGFILYGLVKGAAYAMQTSGTDPGPYGREAIFQLEWINLYWGLVNLLPVLPLDGGRICEELCRQYVRRGNPTELALKIGVGVGALAAVFFFSQDRTYPAILFALLALQNFQSLQAFSGGRGIW